MKPSLKIPLIYIFLGSIWVALSSLYISAIQEKIGIENSTRIEVIKAVLFVVASGVLIYFLVERALLHERQLWSSYIYVFNNSPICMWMVVKKDQTIYAANHIAGQNFGPKREGEFPLKFDEIFSLKRRDKKLVFGGEKYELSNQKINDRSGKQRVMDLYSVPFTRGRKELIMIIAVDNTDLRQSLLEKVKLNANLKEQNDQLMKFSFMNSHNLRRPLSNIMGIIDLIDENERNKKETIHLLKESSDQLDLEIRRMNEALSNSNLHIEMTERKKTEKLRTMLIVDDDKVQQMINKRLLLKYSPDLELYFFENPVDALQWIKGHSVNVILLDINMPEMTGWEFLDALKEMEIEVEVKMLSSSIDPKDKEKSKQYEMVSGFLVKPLRKESMAEIWRG